MARAHLVIQNNGAIEYTLTTYATVDKATNRRDEFDLSIMIMSVMRKFQTAKLLSHHGETLIFELEIKFDKEKALSDLVSEYAKLKEEF